MHIQLIRYYSDRRVAKSTLLINSLPFGEAREPVLPATRHHPSAPLLSPGTYRYQPVSTSQSPMSLKVCRSQGLPRVTFGWSLFRQTASDTICIGQSSPSLPPEERTLQRQQETFSRFVTQVYEAFAKGEPMTLEVTAQKP